MKARNVQTLILLFLLCFAVTLTGCSTAGDGPEESMPVQVTLYLEAPSTVNVSNIPGLSLATAQKELSGSDAQVEYSLENATDTAYTFGPSTISIEGLQDGEWYRLASRTGEGYITADSIATMLEPHDTFLGAQSFYPYGDCVPAGTYRLVIGVSLMNGPGSSTDEYLAAEFSIVE